MLLLVLTIDQRPLSHRHEQRQRQLVERSMVDGVGVCGPWSVVCAPGSSLFLSEVEHGFIIN